MMNALYKLAVFASILWLAKAGPIQSSAKYYVFEEQVEFTQAYALCRKHGLTLATEKTEEETLELNAALTNLTVTPNNFWLSGLNITNYGVIPPSSWIWFDSLEEVNYTNWNADEPTSGYNCLIKNPVRQGTGGKWASRSCTTKLSFICQSRS